MGIGQLGAQIQLEVIVPVDLLVAELDRLAAVMGFTVMFFSRTVDDRIDVLIENSQTETVTRTYQLELLQKSASLNVFILPSSLASRFLIHVTACI